MMTLKHIFRSELQVRLLACLFFLLLSALMSSNTYAADIRVSVDRNPVSVDESFQITFTASQSPDDDPDFSPLEQDFNIINQSNRSSSYP